VLDRSLAVDPDDLLYEAARVELDHGPDAAVGE
jgi:hypothetical protein